MYLVVIYDYSFLYCSPRHIYFQLTDWSGKFLSVLAYNLLSSILINIYSGSLWLYNIFQHSLPKCCNLSSFCLLDCMALKWSASTFIYNTIYMHAWIQSRCICLYILVQFSQVLRFKSFFSSLDLFALLWKYIVFMGMWLYGYIYMYVPIYILVQFAQMIRLYIYIYQVRLNCQILH